MGPLALALVSGLTWGAGDFVGGLMSRRFPTALVLLVGQSAGLLLTAGLVAAAADPIPEARLLVIGGLGGLFGAVGLASLYRGLAVGRMSIVAPTASLSGTVPVIAGFVQGERPAALQLIGMALALAGVLLAVRAPDPAGTDRTGMAGIGFALLAALSFGLLVLSLDAVGAESPLWASLSIRLVSVPLFLGAAIVTARGSRAPTRAEAGAMVGAGLLDNGANITFAIAAQQGLLTLVSVLGSLYPVATVLLARWILHERLAPWQLVGVVAAFTGVALIAVG